MDTERILWIASLIGVIITAALRGGVKKIGLLIALYGAFMFGYIGMADAGGVEARFAPLVLVLNLIILAIGGIWLLVSRAKKQPQAAAALLLAVALVSGYYVLPLADAALPGWDLAAWLPGQGQSADLSVHYIDVGQGDAILIKTAEKAVLIDGGTRGAGQTVVDYLASQGITKLDIVIGTHPHEDHIGGLITVLAQLEVGEVLDPGVVHTSKTFEDYLDIIESRNIPFVEARVGMSRDLGSGVGLQILHPENPSSSHLNDASVVARVTSGNIAFIFTGDAEVRSEQEILDRGVNVRANVLKVGHHGSETSSSAQFLNAVRPAYAVISAGDGNQYFHPHQPILDRLRAANIKVYRTDLHGTVVISIKDGEISVSTQRQADSDSIFTAPPR